MQHLAKRRRELLQAVVAQVQTEEMPELLLDHAVVQETGQGVQLVTRQVQEVDPVLPSRQSSRTLSGSKTWAAESLCSGQGGRNRPEHLPSLHLGQTSPFLLEPRENEAKLPLWADLPYLFCEDSQASASVWPFWGRTAHSQQ